MNIIKLTIIASAVSLFAIEAHAQTNHNTTGSNKTQPVVPDTDTNSDDKKAKAAADKIGDIPGESQRAATGYIKIGDIKGESTRSVQPTGCVTLSGGKDEDCDGVEDDKAVSATDYNSSRSNKADTASDVKPDDDTSGAITKATD